MKRPHRNILLFLFISGFLITFYSILSTRTFLEVKELKNLLIQNIDNSQIQLNIKALAENKSILNHEIKKMQLFLLNRNDTIGVINSDTMISLPSRSQTVIKLPVILITTKVASILEKNLDTINLNLVGSALVKFFFFEFNKDINIPINLPLKESLFSSLNENANQERIIKIKDAKISKVGLTKSQLLINFQLNNPYDLVFTLKDYPSEVYINNRYSGNGSLQYPILVDTLQKYNDGIFVFELDNIDTITSLYSSLLTGKIKYTTKGFLILEILNYNIKIPYSFSGEIK